MSDTLATGGPGMTHDAGPVISGAARRQIEMLIQRFPQKRSALLPGLFVIQEEIGWVPPRAMEELADMLDVEPVQVQETASFYTMYFKQPVGRYVVDVCTNIACMLLGGYEVSRALQAHYGIKPGQTTADNLVTLREVECLAACAGAPCAQINYEYYENLTPEGLIRTLESLAANGTIPGKPVSSGALTAGGGAGTVDSASATAES